MADFFKKEEKEEPKEELIKIGETEYKPEELESMVGLASKVKGFEEKSGTDFDGLTSSWGKRGEEIGRLKGELEEATKEPEVEPTKEELSQEQVDKQVKDELGKHGVVLKSDLDNWFEEKASSRETAKELLGDCKGLETKIDGKDGRPEFKTEDILTHMKETGIKSPQDAYDLKYKSELNIWREKKIMGKKPSGLITEEESTGEKQPPKVKITPQNLGESVKEALHSG